ncbi:MAG: rhomboid family intramembrane serine protease [Muribaculaceae bacterium]|nr:rhomboid family intramembrane serine protease [Muribaculaceae bacterium]
MSIVDDLKTRYQSSSLLMRFIYINIAVFVVLRVVGFMSFLLAGSSASFVQWVELPSNFHDFLCQPWTLITYMFSHYDVMHILFNMLWLYWLGRIFLEFFTPRQMGGLYVLGGIGGAALYLVCYNLIPHLSSQQSLLLGASASVLAIVVAIAIYRPDYPISLFLFGSVALKWIAIITVFIDIIGIENNNLGGHLAHLGGALVGLWFGLSIKRGHDITSWINRSIDSLVMLFKKRQPKAKKSQETGQRKSYNYHESTLGGSSATKPKDKGSNSSDATGVDEEKLDEILGKLKQSGYAALTDEEREFLFNASRKR